MDSLNYFATVVTGLLALSYHSVLSADRELINKPAVTLFSTPNFSGSKGYELIAHYIPDLKKLSWKGPVRSACITAGAWIFFEHPEFNGKHKGYVEYVYGESASPSCFRLMKIEGSVNSIRFAGSFLDYRWNTLTVYWQDYFQGLTFKLIEHDLPSIGFGPQSLIVTGTKSWTLFTKENYAGESVCFDPLVPDERIPGFYPNLKHITEYTGELKSVKIGCRSTDSEERRIRPDSTNFSNRTG